MPTTNGRKTEPVPVATQPLVCRGCKRPLGEQLSGRAIRLGNVVIYQRVVYHCAECAYRWEWRPINGD
jgi:RNase P subunit RPR2